MFKVFRTKIAIAGVAVALGGCAHFVPSTRVTPPTQPALQGVAAARGQTVQMQIFLDANHFRPGMIGGRLGVFFEKALGIYKSNHVQPADAPPDVSGLQRYATYTGTTHL